MPEFSAYERSSLIPTVVHLGPGVFHRAHQGMYNDALLRTGARAGAVWGISLRSAALRDALSANDFVYHVVERSSVPAGEAGAGQIETVTAVGSLLGVDVAARDIEAAVRRLIEPAVTVVTITVTERGYCALTPGGPLDLSRAELRHDLEHPAAPRSVPGLVLEALLRRRAAGTPPFTVVSCDNLPDNGRATQRVVTEFAECVHPESTQWVRANVAFPSSMVDRMVPATTQEDRSRLEALGVRDPWPVVTEPFSQWVLQDTFPTGRPAWERVGVELVSDVALHEQAKLRILNAAHSALAYWGLLAGHRLVSQAATDPLLRAATHDLLLTEALPTLRSPAGWDLRAYADHVLERFADSALPYTAAKVATDGSQKLPVRLIPTVRARLADGAPAPRCAQLLAAWVACLKGPQSAALAIADAGAVPPSPAPGGPPAGGLDAVAAVDQLLCLPGFFDVSSAADRGLMDRVGRYAEVVWRGGVRRLLQDGQPDRRQGMPS